AVLGRAVVAGICDQPLEIDTYRELLGKEAEVIGTNDHLLQELPLLVEIPDLPAGSAGSAVGSPAWSRRLGWSGPATDVSAAPARALEKV
ncbi:MAG TPA: hypothetical protein PKE61_11550, partial [Burkholderiaceae bacterium]|nr:hypothetical protein [Burkholderiaceae bacterium]